MFIRWLTIRFSKNQSAMWGIIMIGCIGSVIMAIRGCINLATDTSMQIFMVAVLLKLFLGDEELSHSDVV